MTGSANKRWLIPIGLSVLSGLIVTAQVFLAHRVPTVSRGMRLLVAERDIPRGGKLHPRDFSFKWTQDNELIPGLVTDQMVQLMWGKPLRSALRQGDWLHVDAVAVLEKLAATPPRKIRSRVEVIGEEGDS